MHDHNGAWVLLSGFVEERGSLRPLEIEVVPGVVAELGTLRVQYPDAVAAD